MNWFTELADTWRVTTLGNKIWLVSWMAAVWILPIWMLLDSGVTPWKVFLVVPVLSALITSATVKVGD